MKIAFKYSACAVVATLSNLLVQYICFFFYAGEKSIYIAILMGTAAGLLCKFYLDKKYIFAYHSTNMTQQGKTFLLYTFTGVFTTVIFWGTEIIFNMLSTMDAAKYIGATVGLSIGYMVKYQLDKKYVFIGGLS